ncbi:NAD(P)-binding domain-containing protein (plasmid) [Sphingobium sp. V4]|uniref:NADPH-dependent F420 reductase n=1 Tax=Sphingobium sp. V4 TaxID=3038927 RepID=UPI0025581E7F|nr:NAD(P)-binding domain-containing protein [Sphingobium sp. V4]WIW90308.1 NAD(P)-binding domain-containing protein [Sphingobium sp. V4]
MTYSIIGSGAIGTALARQFARTNTPVLIANTRGSGSLAALAGELGSYVRPAELSDALQADTIILAVPFSAIDAVAAAAADWTGKVVIDATNAINFTDFSPADLGGRLSSDIVAQALPGAAVVKAFNTLPAAVLAQEPGSATGKRTIFHSSNDPDASATAAQLIEALGYAAINLGRIDEGGRLQQFGGALMVHSLIKQG